MRRDLRRMDDKLNILVDHQIQNEERFVRNEARLARLAARTDAKFAMVADLQVITEKKFAEVAQFQAITEKKFAEVAQFQAITDKNFAEVAQFQAITDKNFAELIHVLRKKENGNSSLDHR